MHVVRMAPNARQQVARLVCNPHASFSRHSARARREPTHHVGARAQTTSRPPRSPAATGYIHTQYTPARRAPTAASRQRRGTRTSRWRITIRAYVCVSDCRSEARLGPGPPWTCRPEPRERSRWSSNFSHLNFFLRNFSHLILGAVGLLVGAGIHRVGDRWLLVRRPSKNTCQC
jgi:hypothetical protein